MDNRRMSEFPPPQGAELESQPILRHQNGETNKEIQEHIQHLQKEAFQLANYYFVFQGVIFTAVYSAPSDLKCKYRWVPFTLSLVAGVLNLSAICMIACKHKKVLDDDDKTGTKTNGDAHGANNRCPPQYLICLTLTRLRNIIVCMALFCSFFIIMLIGCMLITCDQKSPKTASASPS